MFESPAKSSEADGSIAYSVGAYSYDFESLWNEEEDGFERVTVSAPDDAQTTQVKTPESLLKYALHLDQPELNFPEVPLKRVRLSKKTQWIGYTLSVLQGNPMAEVMLDYNRKERIHGRGCFKSLYIRLTGKSWRTVHDDTNRLWAASSIDVQNRWAFVAHLWNKLYSGKSSANRWENRIMLPDGSKFESSLCVKQVSSDSVLPESFGLLLTYHTNFGLDNPRLRKELEEKSNDDIVEWLKSQKEYQDMFEVFRGHSAILAGTYNFKNYSLAMEHCPNSAERLRIHFHVFLGQQCGFTTYTDVYHKVTVKKKHVLWNNIFPHVSIMRCRGSNGIANASANGLYYCSAPKVGQIFSWATVKPFVDCRVGSVWCFIT